MLSQHQVLSTKLQKPSLPDDFVYRERLIKYINDNRERPFTLVSAGAGFGKSTFISSWLKDTPVEYGWVSLDKNDNDLRTFLTYFIAAVQKGTPSFSTELEHLLQSSELPPLNVLIKVLINDLVKLKKPFILVLDDFHTIKNRDIFEVIGSILKYPPKLFHLVLITRSDPPLPLAGLRSKNKVKDIRAGQLQLSNDEIRKFIEKYFEDDNLDGFVDLLEGKLEGWAAGLRLVLLHFSFTRNKDELINKLSADSNFSAEYFLEEVINQLNGDVKEFLLKTSILEKFSGELTDYLLASSEREINSDNIIHKLIAGNIFIINLDTENKWFRYHHLFQSLLRKEVKKFIPRNEIKRLHKRAFEWYERNGFIDESFYHALKLDDLDLVAGLIEINMHKPFNEDKWFVLEKWLKLLPESFLHKKPTLLIAKLWILQHKVIIWEIPPLLRELYDIKKEHPLDKELEVQAQFFEGVLLFWEAKVKASYEKFKYVNENLSADKKGAKGVNIVYYATAAHMCGKGDEVAGELEKLYFNDNFNLISNGLLLGGIIFIKMLKGDLYSTYDYIVLGRKYAVEKNDVFIDTWLDYYEGSINYQQNKLTEAEKYFKKALENVYLLNVLAPVDSFLGMLLTLQGLKKKDEFNKMLKRFDSFIVDSGNQLYKNYSYSIKAFLSLLDNKINKAESYISRIDEFFDSGNTLFWIEAPRVTKCRVLLAKNDANAAEEAINQLMEIWNFAKNTRNIPLTIKTLILLAAAYEQKGENEKALKTIERAVKKAQPGHWLRPFFEGGVIIYNLLMQLDSDNSYKNFRNLLLKEFSDFLEGEKTDKMKDNQPVSVIRERLTNREMDIMFLLAQRYTNKEIANKLFIAPATVKRHTISIYHKLNVNSRREAVLAAEKLNIIPSTSNY